MEQRPLGRTGLTISAIGLGLGSAVFGGRTDEQSVYRVMDYAVEKGITFFDTAESYALGTSERVFGNWLRLRKCRDTITIVTKFWMPGAAAWGGADYIRKALEGSLERLRTDYVDGYLIHYPDPHTPVAETLAALTAEVQAGRVRAIGCSNFSARELREALAVSASRGYPRFELTEAEYSLGTSPLGIDSYTVGLLEAEDRLFPLCQMEDVAATIYSPLAAGFLTGKHTREGPTATPGSRFHNKPNLVRVYHTERNFRILGRLRDKAAELGMPMVRLAMAWAMTQPAVTAVIIGARATEYIDAAIEAYQTRLDPQVRAEMSDWTRD